MGTMRGFRLPRLELLQRLLHRRRAVQPPPPPLTVILPGRRLLEYSVGGFRVSLVDAGGELVYVAEPTLDQGLLEELERRLDEVVALMRRGNDLGDVLVAVLGIDRGKVAEAVYALRSLVGYRKLQVLLDDPYVEDISVSGPGYVWVKHSWVEQALPEIDFIRTNIYLGSLDEVVELQQIVATKCGTYISTSNPVVDAQLPPRDGGHRVHLVAYTISTPRRPEIVVRKRMSTPPHMDQLVEQGVLPRAVAELFRVLVHARGSLIVAGPPGSGKTTLIRSILYSYVPRGWKVAVIEDTGEIDPPPGEPWTRYTTFELGAVKVDLFDLAKASLRASATRLVVVGETRGAEAQVLAQALLVGLGAITSFHGGSPEEVVVRFSSPPIGLTPSQVGMFHLVALMGFGERPRRQLKRLAELVYDREGDRVEVNTVWDRERDGLGVGLDTLISRLRRWEELRARAEVPVEVILNGLFRG